MANGVIKRVVSERGFGFIKPMEGKDLFFHSSQFLGKGLHELREGQEVDFEIAQGPQGIRAVRIRPLGDRARKRPEDGGKNGEALPYMKDNTRAKRRALRDRDKRCRD
jgi:CspA family cold shock protein